MVSVFLSLTLSEPNFYTNCNQELTSYDRRLRGYDNAVFLEILARVATVLVAALQRLLPMLMIVAVMMGLSSQFMYGRRSIFAEYDYAAAAEQ